MFQKAMRAASMVRIVVVLAICLSAAECAAGSCLNYGHACWGGHGKRNGRQEILPRLINNEAPPNRVKPEWFLSKIMSPLDLRYYRDENELDASRNQPEIDDPLTGTEDESVKSIRQWEKIRDLLKNSNKLPASIGGGRAIDKFLKSPEVLEKQDAEE